MGTDYKGGSPTFRKVSDNLQSLKEKYKYNNGKFGEPGQSKDSSIRNIISDNPTETAKQFYDDLTYGGIESNLMYKDGTIKGKHTQMADGTTVNYRYVSSSSDKSPAVDIDVQFSNSHGTLITQKIHFIKGGQ